MTYANARRQDLNTFGPTHWLYVRRSERDFSSLGYAAPGGVSLALRWAK